MALIANVFLTGSTFYILVDFKGFLLGSLWRISRTAKTYRCSLARVEETNQELSVNCLFDMQGHMVTKHLEDSSVGIP